MNAPLPAAQREAMNTRERRLHRAAIARRVRAGAPDQAHSLDWEALDQAPSWLALPDEELAHLQRAVGAVVHDAELRLWIDGSSIAAARSAVGQQVWQGLMDPRSRPAGGVGLSAIGSRLNADPNTVSESLARVGTSVLLAALPHGPLRTIALELFAPIAAAEIVEPLAQSILAKAQALLDAKEGTS